MYFNIIYLLYTPLLFEIDLALKSLVYIYIYIYPFSFEQITTIIHAEENATAIFR